MTTTFPEFKQCLKIQGALDLEALDVIFIEPLKELHSWWTRQSAFTQSFVNFFTAGLGLTALVAFLAKVLQMAVADLALAFAEALGAIIVGIALGTVFDVLARCEIQSLVP
jgi:FtsH-binding integral membrane protein